VNTLFAGVLARGPVAEAVGERAWLQAMLDFEAALARAQAAVGLIPADAAEAIADAAQAEGFDAAEIGAAAAGGGNPAQPLVKALTAAVASDKARGHVHRGATSQDVVDTAAMLVSRMALDLILVDLRAAADAAGTLAGRWSDTPMVGRTLMQQAVPTTFGLKAAGWMVGLDAATDALVSARERLAVQLGGAAGTLASLGDKGPAVMHELARLLGLAEPLLPWHTDRTRIAQLAGALGETAGALAKPARDVILLSQTEVGEVVELASGGSSTMPHKRNPVAAISALACARRAPALAGGLLGSMDHEHERAAGAWHAEWAPLMDLLVAVGAAASWLRASLSDLQPDPERMRSNLDMTGGLVLAERVSTELGRVLGRGVAHDVIERAAQTAGDHGRPFGEVLAEDETVRAHLTAEEIDELLDPEGYLGSAEIFVDRALEAHRARRSGA
jgi:3-carboxy-cis,cis-muconate cycloisomerase